MDAGSENCWLIVGLGNPGLQYEKTRHNLGFMLVDKLASEMNAAVKREECSALVGQGEFENAKVELVKPQTYMNLSGEAVACLLKKTGRVASIENLIVISDDLALPFGKIRLRPGGSAGGHNGLKSLISSLGTDRFIRLRIGIQPEHPLNDARKFVLDPFSKNDWETVEQTLTHSVQALASVIRDGIERSMAVFN
ncbi:MAG TPA: aminoacyl-tRNA hydrolase [Pyrinomonadaceae bacterium]|jgi:PTH1 family peptidyl-tRNA hydrolase|nr:aminoacyl-tRNA hydrolase [Pyrinomonadaceae bacterium]